MYIVYKIIGGNIIPTGEIKKLPDFLADEIFMCPVCVGGNWQQKPYKVISKNKQGENYSIISVELGV